MFPYTTKTIGTSCGRLLKKYKTGCCFYLPKMNIKTIETKLLYNNFAANKVIKDETRR